MEKILLICCCGVVGGVVAEKYKFPGGAIVGSMLFSGILSIILSENFHLSRNMSMTVQIILGISIGITFERSFLNFALQILPIAIISTLVLLTAAFLMAYITSKLGLVDFGTAFFGFSPGGMSGMSLIAYSEGYQTGVVAFLHVVRIFTLFIVVPLISRLYMSFH